MNNKQIINKQLRNNNNNKKQTKMKQNKTKRIHYIFLKKINK